MIKYKEARSPNSQELQDLVNYISTEGYPRNKEEVIDLLACAYVMVCAEYQAVTPGYCGKVIVVLWGINPEVVHAFTYKDGKINWNSWEEEKEVI